MILIEGGNRRMWGTGSLATMTPSRNQRLWRDWGTGGSCVFWNCYISYSLGQARVCSCGCSMRKPNGDSPMSDQRSAKPLGDIWSETGAVSYHR